MPVYDRRWRRGGQLSKARWMNELFQRFPLLFTKYIHIITITHSSTSFFFDGNDQMRHWKEIPIIFKIVQALNLKLGLLFSAHMSGAIITNCHFLLLLEMVDVLVIIILLKVPLNVFLLSLVSPEILVPGLAPRLSITGLWCFVEMMALGLMWML